MPVLVMVGIKVLNHYAGLDLSEISPELLMLGDAILVYLIPNAEPEIEARVTWPEGESPSLLNDRIRALLAEKS